MKERDKQFQGFAKALWDEIGGMQDSFCEECGTGLHSLAKDMDRAEILDRSIQQLIARRVYDLVRHAALHIDDHACDVLGFEEAMRLIPDMTELPKEQDERD